MPGKNDPAQQFQQIMQQLTQGGAQGGAPDAFDFTTEPTAAAGGDGQRDVLVGASGSDWFNFQPQFTTEPTAPEPYMSGYAQWQNNYGTTPSGSGTDLLMSDPNADLLATPGPDDNVGLPAADGLLLPY